MVEDILLTIIRTFFFYVVLLLIFRFMGKREIGELSVLDLVVFIMIAELASVAIEDTSVHFSRQLVPMVTLMIIQVLFAIVSLKSQKFRQFVDGRPSVLIYKGNIDEKEMRKQRYNFDDLLLQLREQNVKSVGDVEFAILETSGKLTVYEKEKGKKRQPDFLIMPLILDGIIQKNNVKKIGKSEEWLQRELSERGYSNTSTISFCSFQNGEFIVDTKDI